MKFHTRSTNRIKMSFGKNPLSGIFITNTLTRERSCINGTQQILVRTPLQVSEPTLLTMVRSVRAIRTGLEYELVDSTRAYRARIHIKETPDGIRYKLYVDAPEPIWLVEWRLSGFMFDEVVVPALGGQSLSSDMPTGTTLSYKYPFWWNAQFVVGSQRSGTCWIRSKDSAPDLKLLRITREEKGFAITYGFEAPAPLRSKSFQAEWFIDCHRGDWRVPVDVHRRWLEEEFRPQRVEANRHFPVWAHDINFVLELWGAGKDRVKPMHTFDQMISRLKQWKKLHDPLRTMVYIPGFAEHGIDSRAPDYNPSKELGGEEKFKKFVDAAHAMGYRVMVHTNVLAMTFAHKLFPKFKQHRVVDAFGRVQGWGLDIDGDWLFEPYFAYINPGAKKWGDLMERVIGALVRKFKIDAVFLDQTLLAFNVSKGPNFLVGMREHVKRLQKAFPDILFAGEGLHEQVFAVLPMAQIHGIDSIAEVHGMDGTAIWRKAHPVSTNLFSPFTRFVAHLLTKYPSHPLFKLQEGAYEQLGVIPALCLYDSEQNLDIPAVRKMVKRANRLMPLE